MKKFNFQKNKAFTILELLITIFVILTALLAGIYTISSTVATTSVYKHQLVAAYLAQEGIELVRYIRDTNFIQGILWTEGKLDQCDPKDLNNPTDGKYCEAEHDPGNLASFNESVEPRFLKISDTSPKFYNYTSGINTPFQRKIIIVSEGSDTLKVTVEVIWETKGKKYSFVAQEKIFNWKQ